MPAATVLHLMRHGEHALQASTLVGRSDTALSETGRTQVRVAALTLTSAGIDEVLTSPRRRCRESGEIVSHHLGRRLAEAAELDEVDFGLWTGRTFADLAGDPDWARWNSERATARPPSGESMGEAQTRAIQCVTNLAAGKTGARLVLVTHAEIIRCLLLSALQWPLASWHRIELAPASMTAVRLTTSGLEPAPELVRC